MGSLAKAPLPGPSHIYPCTQATVHNACDLAAWLRQRVALKARVSVRRSPVETGCSVAAGSPGPVSRAAATALRGPRHRRIRLSAPGSLHVWAVRIFVLCRLSAPSALPSAEVKDNAAEARKSGAGWLPPRCLPAEWRPRYCCDDPVARKRLACQAPTSVPRTHCHPNRRLQIGPFCVPAPLRHIVAECEDAPQITHRTSIHHQ